MIYRYGAYNFRFGRRHALRQGLDDDALLRDEGIVAIRREDEGYPELENKKIINHLFV